MRRNLLIAQSLTRSFPGAAVLMIAGAVEASAFATPEGVDCLTLPALYKDGAGDYRSRQLRVRLPELIALRSAAIHAAVESFRPDVLIVDKVPRGVADELIPTLDGLKAAGRTRCVLGWREILDDKEATLAEWRQRRTLEAIRTYFDAVWVYGDATVFNMLHEYDLPNDVAGKVHFTGYLNQRNRIAWQRRVPVWAQQLPREPFVLCALGGGQDGAPLARAFVEAVRPTGRSAVLLTGPCMPSATRRALAGLAAEQARLHVLEFVPEADWLMHRAERVVAMGGYNTVASILSFHKRALLVPRTHPRQEQIVRARRLQSLGLVDMLHPRDATPQCLRRWIVDAPRAPLARRSVDLGGLGRIRRLVADLARAGGGAHQPPTAQKDLADAQL